MLIPPFSSSVGVALALLRLAMATPPSVPVHPASPAHLDRSSARSAPSGPRAAADDVQAPPASAIPASTAASPAAACEASKTTLASPPGTAPSAQVLQSAAPTAHVAHISLSSHLASPASAESARSLSAQTPATSEASSLRDEGSVIQAAVALFPPTSPSSRNSVAARRKFADLESRILAIADEISGVRGQISPEAIDAIDYTIDAVARTLRNPDVRAVPLDQAVLYTEIAAALSRIDVAKALRATLECSIVAPSAPENVRKQLVMIDQLRSSISELLRVVHGLHTDLSRAQSRIASQEAEIRRVSGSHDLAPSEDLDIARKELAETQGALTKAQPEIQKLKSEIATRPRPPVVVSGPRSKDPIPPVPHHGEELRVDHFTSPVYDDLHRLYKVAASRERRQLNAKIEQLETQISDLCAEHAADISKIEDQLRAEVQTAIRDRDELRHVLSGFNDTAYGVLGLLTHQVAITENALQIPSFSAGTLSPSAKSMIGEVASLLSASVKTPSVSDPKISGLVGASPPPSVKRNRVPRSAARNASAINSAIACEDNTVDLTAGSSDPNIKVEGRKGRTLLDSSSSKRKAPSSLSRTTGDDDASPVAAKRPKRNSADVERLPIYDLSKAHRSFNDLPPIPDDGQLSIEDRLANADQTCWPFKDPAKDATLAAHYTGSELSELIDQRLPFYSHTPIPHQRYPKVASSHGLRQLTEDQYQAFTRGRPWQSLVSMLPRAPVTFEKGRCHPDLAAFWDALIEFDKAHIRWFWERTHHLVTEAEVSNERKLRHGKMKAPFIQLLDSVAKMISRGIVDVDILLEPAILRYVHTALPVFVSDASPKGIEDHIAKIDARWPERTYHLAHPDLHVSSHPLVNNRIVGKFDLDEEP